jgi:hypothetical protein
MRTNFRAITGSLAVAAAALFAVAGVARAALVDVTLPGDSAVPYNSSGTPTSPLAEQAPNIIDNSSATKYLNSNFNGTDPGVIIAPSAGFSIVKGLTFTSANDSPERDPATYKLEGSNDGGATFLTISSGAVPAFSSRFQTVSVGFSNSTLYGNYRLTFPTVTNPGAACCMQIAETELLASKVIGDVTQPGDAITAFNSSGSPSSPPAEGVANVIDNNAATKYLNSNFNGTNPGFTVTPSVGLTLVTGIGIRTANDDPERDPSSVTLQGSNDGVNFVDIIANMTIPTSADRFDQRNFEFGNAQPFLHYRVFFPTVADAGSSCCMQVGEVELIGQAVPTPAALPAGLGLLALAAVRRWRSR